MQPDTLLCGGLMLAFMAVSQQQQQGGGSIAQRVLRRDRGKSDLDTPVAKAAPSRRRPSAGAVAGMAVGGVAGFGAGAALTGYFIRRRISLERLRELKRLVKQECLKKCIELKRDEEEAAAAEQAAAAAKVKADEAAAAAKAKAREPADTEAAADEAADAEAAADEAAAAAKVKADVAAAAAKAKAEEVIKAKPICDCCSTILTDIEELEKLADPGPFVYEEAIQRLKKSALMGKEQQQESFAVAQELIKDIDKCIKELEESDITQKFNAIMGELQDDAIKVELQDDASKDETQDDASKDETQTQQVEQSNPFALEDLPL